MQPLSHSNGASLSAATTPPLSLDTLALDAAALTRLDAPMLAALAQRLAAALAAVAAAQFQHAITPIAHGNATPPHMIDADAACAVLHCPRRWLFTHARRMPWIKRLSRKVILIDEAGMYRYIATRPH